MHLLALSGSLRSRSKNSTMLRAMALLAPAFHAQAALVETLRVMSAVVMETRVEVPISGQEVTEAQVLENPATAALLRTSLAAVMAAVEQQRLAQGA